MKRIVWFMMILTALVLLASCSLQMPETSDTIADETLPETTTTAEVTTTEEPTLSIVEAGKTEYTIILADALYRDTEFRASVETLVKTVSNSLTVKSDRVAEKAYEILVGATSREASKADDGFYYTQIKLVDNALVFTGDNKEVLYDALESVIGRYAKDGTFAVPLSIAETVSLDRFTSESNGKLFSEMADEVYTAFNDKYFKHGWVQGHAYWDKAEMIETYIDAYEATGSDVAKKNMKSYADMFIKQYRGDWSRNEFNDDIMWACIAFSRMAKLLDNETYIEYAKTNFDIVWERAYDTVLDGGLYWRIENTTKNSCVNCPGAIAACLIAELTGDRSYYDKAKLLMDWEFKYMFEPNTGRVYDSYSVDGKINKWASTYNQGTFIGACTLLDQAFGDEEGGEIYLQYAAKAAEYAMTKLVNQNGIIDNGEASLTNRDLPGFKAILVRWLYRYAKYTEDLEVLTFLQNNASYVYRMKNDAGLIWTDWTKKTPAQRTIDGNENYVVFGMSTAVALMYNCMPWW